MPKRPDLFDAFWAPALDSDMHPHDSLEAAFEWLRGAERRYGARGVLVMNASSMRRNNRVLETAPWEIVSTRSRYQGERGPVLAVYPTDRTLEYAEVLARRSAICVIGGSSLDVSPWIRRTGAICIVDGYEVDLAEHLPAEVMESLDQMVDWGGHNNFLGPSDKPDAIRRLREIASRPDAPSREAIESHLRTNGGTASDGVTRAGQWYDEIRRGTRHRDYRGQEIR